MFQAKSQSISSNMSKVEELPESLQDGHTQERKIKF